MEKKPERHKFLAYSRRSSEDSTHQVLSIENQMRELQEHAKRHNLDIVEYLHEEKSAHKRGRPIFAQMMGRIERGEANALLVWIPSRLARNAFDGGWVITLMDDGLLKEVRTPGRVYRNTSDDKFLLSLEFGMAKKSRDDLRSHVKTGYYTKVLKGIRNGPAPQGYLNNPNPPKGDKDIIVDPGRFELVQRLLLSFLAGEYSVRNLQKEAARWGLTTRQTRKQGGKPIQLSHIYRILTDPFYAGYFYANNPNTGEREFHKGAHVPMITMEQFDLIQAKLGRKGKPRPRTSNFFPFTGRMECGECGSMITAEEKYQIICDVCKHKFASGKKDACPKCGTRIVDMKNPTLLHYLYYHCTKRKNPKCTQRSITVDDLETLLDRELAKFNVSDGFVQWALEELAVENEETIKGHNAIITSQQERYKVVVARLQNLAKLYTSPENANNELLTLEEYAPQRKELLDEKKKLEDAQQETGRKVEEWVDWAENSFNYAAAARTWFENGTLEEKRDIFASLSRSNLTFTDKKLTISLKKPLDLYAAIVSKYPSTAIPLEHENNGSNKEECLPFAADIPGLRRRRDSNPRGR